MLGGMAEAEATFNDQLAIITMMGKQTIMDGRFTRCMLYSVYAVLGVCCCWCILYLVYIVLGECIYYV